MYLNAPTFDTLPYENKRLTVCLFVNFGLLYRSGSPIDFTIYINNSCEQVPDELYGGLKVLCSTKRQLTFTNFAYLYPCD